jgi:hypothetical protein
MGAIFGSREKPLPSRIFLMFLQGLGVAAHGD